MRQKALDAAIDDMEAWLRTGVCLVYVTRALNCRQGMAEHEVSYASLLADLPRSFSFILGRRHYNLGPPVACRSCHEGYNKPGAVHV